jgi:hypothetical protein
MPASPKPTTSAFLPPVRSAGNGNFDAPQLAIANFGYEAGGWRVERHLPGGRHRRQAGRRRRVR